MTSPGVSMNKSATWTVLGIVLVMALTGSPASAGDDGDLIARVRASYDRFKTNSDASRIARAARELGPVVDEARKISLRLEQLRILRDLLEVMRTRTEQLLAGAEYKTRQNEAGLERLYRSQEWDDLGFAEASFIYWAAWIDLEIARQTLSGKDSILARAREGFQTASLQLFRPGLFYGGWLGIACVDLEQGHFARAQQIFRKLDEALSASPDSPIKKAILLEIRLQEAHMGNTGATGISHNIDAEQAEMLRMEVFALLERSRKEGRILEGVTPRLQALINAGRLDQSLLENMMAYAQEIAAIDVRPWNVLAAAEFRLQHKDYQKALQEYEAFFNEFIAYQEINLDGFRYRWAFAAYKDGSYQAALRILEKLARRQRLTTELDKAVAKLLYTVHVARELSGAANTDRKSLHAAAQQFVYKNPDDPEADNARLYLAHTLPGIDDSLKMLGRIRSSAQFGGEVERTAFDFIAREFSTRISNGKTEAADDLAGQGMGAFRELPEADRKNLLNVAVLLQMRALADPDPDGLINSLDFLDRLKNTEADEQEALIAAHPDHMIRSLGHFVVREDPDMNIQHALSWSRLHLYDRVDNRVKLTELMHSLNEDDTLKIPLELIYPWIAKREEMAQRLELAQIVHPSAAVLPDMDRRFYSLIIESLLSLVDYKAAHEKALAFTRDHSNSGDAWRLLARTSELTDDPFTADKAWSVITDKSVPSTDIWWEGMLNRVRIRSGSTRPEQACPLLEILQHRTDHLPEGQKTAYETILQNTHCRNINPTT